MRTKRCIAAIMAILMMLTGSPVEVLASTIANQEATETIQETVFEEQDVVDETADVIEEETIAENVIEEEIEEEEIIEEDVSASEDATYFGTENNITWTISNGCLTLSGSGDYTNTPWTADEYRSSITSAKLTVSNMTNCFKMFDGLCNMASIDLSQFDSSKVTNVNFMFSGCTSLSGIDMSGMDLSAIGVDSVDLAVDMINGCFIPGTSMISDCVGLYSIKTPKKTGGLAISLPVPMSVAGKWYDKNGNEYGRYIPANETGSIELLSVKIAHWEPEGPEEPEINEFTKTVDLPSGKADLFYSDTFFYGNSYSYNHNLARFSIGISTLMYGSPKSAVTNVEKLGFSDCKYYKDTTLTDDDDPKEGRYLHSC